jgi:Leucine-rich repeat (LRR) protein
MNKTFIMLFATLLVAGSGVSGCTDSPEIVIADPLFETYCLVHFDKNGNGRVQQDEVNFIKELDVSGLNLQSLKGLEEFTALTRLNCSKNQLIRLYIAKNTALTELYCGSNELSLLDVSSNQKLSFLDCSNNVLSALNVSKNLQLTALYCNKNQLTSLELSKNVALNLMHCRSNEITELELSCNKALNKVDCRDNPLITIYVWQNFKSSEHRHWSKPKDTVYRTI